MTHIPVPHGLLAQDINAYTPEGAERKKKFHSDGRRFLAALARRLGLPPDSYDLRNNEAGIAVSGEVTLHADRLYVQLSESCIAPGVTMLYRSCQGRRDYSGGPNNFARLRDLTNEQNQARLVERLHNLGKTAQPA